MQKFFSTFAAMELEMERFEQAFIAAMGSEVLPMDAVMRYVSATQGKRLRPRLVFLSARLFGTINDVTRRTALFVEMLHTATLIHDDVVDASDERRGQASVNAQWGNKAAVLAGDYLLSKAMLQLADSSDHRILSEMLQTAMAMSEGELLQNEELNIKSEALYLEIVERKTARLFRACCVGGALSVGVSDDIVEKMGDFGLNLGMAFQMRDDIMDNEYPETTALAKRLMPEYFEKTLKTLEAITPFVNDKAAFSSLKEMMEFCADISKI